MTGGAPSVVGRYVIVRPLGHGRLGDLYLATDPSLDREVALRLLPPLAGDMRTRFERALRLRATVWHQALAPIFELGDHDGRLFFTRAFIAGQTLAEIIAARGSIPLARRLHWMEVLCDALAHAHEHGLSGLSLEPADIILSRDGTLTILEAGLPEILEDPATSRDPSYLSPEALNGLARDGRSDIFAVGAVFYELITYEKPFGRGPAAEIRARIAGGARWIRTDAMEAAAARVVERALRFDPAERYQNFRELMADVEHVCAQLTGTGTGRVMPLPGERPTAAPSRSGSREDRDMPAQRRTRQIERYVEEARAALQKHDYELALGRADEAAGLDPDHEAVRELKARLDAALDAVRVDRRVEEATRQASEDVSPPIDVTRARRIDDSVRFTVYRPAVMAPQRWYPLLFFTHLGDRRPDAPPGEPDPAAQVEAEARRALGSAVASFPRIVQDAGVGIPHEALLQIKPSVPGLVFNPPEYSFLWIESVHRAEFKVRAAATFEGRVARGTIAVHMGAIPVAVITVAIPIDARAPADGPAAHDVAQPYRRIFACYSHKDTAIVRQFEHYARGIGDSYMRDVIDLRAGEIWDPRLLAMIDAADVFQLFWSRHSMHSPFVRREWEHALTVDKSHFVRPLYWETPFPESEGLPPPALRARHFASVAIAELPVAGRFGRPHEEEQRRLDEQRIEAEQRRRQEESARLEEEAGGRRRQAEESRRTDVDEARAREEERRRGEEYDRRLEAESEAEMRQAAEAARRALEDAPPLGDATQSATRAVIVSRSRGEVAASIPAPASKPARTLRIAALLAVLATALALFLARC